MRELIASYELPFALTLQLPLTPEPQDFILRAEPSQASADEVATLIDNMVIAFGHMCSCGALSGADIEPWNSGIDSWSEPAHTADGAVEWRFQAVRVCDEAWVMLAQMLLSAHEEHPLRSVSVRASGTVGAVKVRDGENLANPYPGPWRNLSFAVQVDATTSFTVLASFAREPTETEQEQIDVELSGWAVGVMVGAYGVAPVPLDRCAGQPEESPVFIDDYLEWDVLRFRGHTAALDGLLNVFSAISENLVPVTKVEIL